MDGCKLHPNGLAFDSCAGAEELASGALVLLCGALWGSRVLAKEIVDSRKAAARGAQDGRGWPKAVWNAHLSAGATFVVNVDLKLRICYNEFMFRTVITR